MKRLAVPFLKYILGPLLVAILSFYLGQKNESRSDKGYAVLAQALNVQLQDTLNHIDARLDNLETRVLRAENNLLVFHHVPASQPIAVTEPKPPKPQVPAKTVPPAPAPPAKAAPPAKVDTAPGKFVAAPKAAKAPAHKMQIQVPPRLRDL